MPRYLSILGRQPELSLAELERLYDSSSLELFSSTSAIFAAKDSPDIQSIGGSLKIGKVIFELRGATWRDTSTKITQHYTRKFKSLDAKITLGISVYDWHINPRDIGRLGLAMKKSLKSQGVSMRLVPSTDTALSTATSHHNKLGLSPTKVELLIVQGKDGSVVIAESVGTQNITALAKRDQGRPKRDAFVGMLPPKLAQIMINLALGSTGSSPLSADLTQLERQRAIQEADKEAAARVRLLDPFCGTGVLLQEAALFGYDVYGTDLSEKMIRYSRDNLNWLQESHHLRFDWYLHEGDAMTTQWQKPIDAVACEGYLGQPFSAPPSPAKLKEVVGNCNHIMSTFLQNIHAQLTPSTPLCIAVPAWRDSKGNFTHLPLTRNLDSLGYAQWKPRYFGNQPLLYYREDQVVARELLILRRH